MVHENIILLDNVNVKIVKSQGQYRIDNNIVYWFDVKLCTLLEACFDRLHQNIIIA